jgi:hypothetical protein
MTYSQAHFIVNGELPPSELVGIITGNFCWLSLDHESIFCIIHKMNAFY